MWNVLLNTLEPSVNVICTNLCLFKCVKRSRAEMTSMIFTSRRNDWNQALWISDHYVCILLLVRYYCFSDFASATPLKSVISALRMWVAIVSSMCRRYPAFICWENHVYLSTAFQANAHQLLAQFNWEPKFDSQVLAFPFAC